MRKNLLEWSDADVKLAEALLLATGGEGSATLQDILLMGDALDNTIFSIAEIEEAMEKLTAIDYLQILKNKLSLTSTFLAEYETATTAVPEISDTEKIQELLNCHELSELKLEQAREQLKCFKLKNYYQQYQEQFGY